MRVLLVDDSAKMRRMIRSVLSASVEEFVECEDGTGALDAYAAHKPDWVLMDIEMGGKDGITATREIVEAFPEAKVIVVTNHRDPEIMQSAFGAGAVEYILKENLHRVVELIQGRDQ